MTITWSRRRWLTSIVGLFFSSWLLPINRAIAQPPITSLDEDVIRIFVDALLPADNLTPAASEIKVHTQILKDAEQNPALALLIADGSRWLTQNFGSLSALSSDQLERLLQAMSEAAWDSGPRNFYYEMRDRSVMYYYADPRAWAGSVINRPPQPIGYPDSIIS